MLVRKYTEYQRVKRIQNLMKDSEKRNTDMGNTDIQDNEDIQGDANIQGNANIQDNEDIQNDANIQDDAEIKNEIEIPVSEESKDKINNRKCVVAVAVLAAAAVVFACAYFVLNPWNEKSPRWKYIESKSEDEIYWPSKDEFDILGKNQTGVGMMRDGSIDISVLMDSDTDRRLIFSENYLKKFKKELVNRLDTLGVEYAIGFTGNFDEFQYSPETGYVPYVEVSDDNEETDSSSEKKKVIPVAVVRINPETVNHEILELVIRGYEAIRIVNMSEEENSYGGRSVHNVIFSKADYLDENGVRKLVMKPDLQASLSDYKKGDSIVLSVREHPVFEGTYEDEGFVFTSSYITEDFSMPSEDSVILQEIINAISQRKIHGGSYVNVIGAVDSTGLITTYSWGMKYGAEKAECRRIEQILPSLSDTDNVKITYQSDCRKDLSIELNDREDIPKALTEYMSEFREKSDNWDEYNTIYVTCFTKNDRDEFARIIFSKKGTDSNSMLTVVTRGEKYIQMSENITDELLKVDNLKSYDIELKVVNKVLDNEDAISTDTYEIRTDGIIVSEE